MSNIPGVTILSETSTIINHPIGNYHVNFLSILCLVSMVALIIIVDIIITKKDPPSIICGLCAIFTGIIAAALFITGMTLGYGRREDEVIKYEITIDETTPYLALQKYHLIKEENGIYTFETPLTN
jgi:hypothetical protein